MRRSLAVAIVVGIVGARGSAADEAKPALKTADATEVVLHGDDPAWTALRADLAKRSAEELLSLIDDVRTRFRGGQAPFRADEQVEPLASAPKGVAIGVALAKAVASNPTRAWRIEGRALRTTVAEVRRLLGAAADAALGTAVAVPDATAERLLSCAACRGATVETLRRIVVSDGTSGRARSTTERTYLQDYDVEVSSVAHLASPIVGRIEDGLVLDAAARAAAPGCLDVEVSAAWSETKAPIERFETRLASSESGSVVIELPEIRVVKAHGTARVAVGGRLLLLGRMPANPWNEVPAVVLRVLAEP